jgi:hypothetical protein
MKTARARNEKESFAVNDRAYQVCSNCVMDTTDSAITFDEHGVCDHCRDFEENVKPNWHTDGRGRAHLAAIIDQVRTAGKGYDFDCILGLSGGLDSSYLLHLAGLGVRPAPAGVPRRRGLEQRPGREQHPDAGRQAGASICLRR